MKLLICKCRLLVDIGVCNGPNPPFSTPPSISEGILIGLQLCFADGGMSPCSPFKILGLTLLPKAKSSLASSVKTKSSTHCWPEQRPYSLYPSLSSGFSAQSHATPCNLLSSVPCIRRRLCKNVHSSWPVTSTARTGTKYGKRPGSTISYVFLILRQRFPRGPQRKQRLGAVGP